MKHLKISVLLAIIAGSALAETPTFNKDIAPIIYNNCVVCHREGEIGPMPLTTYEEVKAYADTIEYVTEDRYMPPWPPDQDFSPLHGQRGLTDSQIALIAEWVNSGTPEGNPTDPPSLPVFAEDSALGTPDLVLTMDEAFELSGDNKDNYRVFVLPTGLTEDRDIAAIEFRPGNRSVVHHVLMAVDTSGRAQELDAQDPLPGYESFGGFGFLVSDTLPGYTPGARPWFYPKGIGKRLPKGSDLIIQVHYAPWPVATTDQSSVNIFFAREPVNRFAQPRVMLPFDLVRPDGSRYRTRLGAFRSFTIPAGETSEFHGIWDVKKDLSLISVTPHMHYLGKSWEIYMVDEEGVRTNLLKIPGWDFNWQGSYQFPHLLKAKAGSTIHATATYDNTENNYLNPISPPQTAKWGERTSDEMYLLAFHYVEHNDGDENLSVRTSRGISVQAKRVGEELELHATGFHDEAGMISFEHSSNLISWNTIDTVDLSGSEDDVVITRVPLLDVAGEYFRATVQ